MGKIKIFKLDELHPNHFEQIQSEYNVLSVPMTCKINQNLMKEIWINLILILKIHVYKPYSFQFITLKKENSKFDMETSKILKMVIKMNKQCNTFS